MRSLRKKCDVKTEGGRVEKRRGAGIGEELDTRKQARGKGLS